MSLDMPGIGGEKTSRGYNEEGGSKKAEKFWASWLTCQEGGKVV